MTDLEDVRDSTRRMLELEETTYLPQPFPFGNPLSDTHHDEPIMEGSEMTPAWLEHYRRSACQWMFDMVQQYRQPRHIVYVGMYFVDTFVRTAMDETWRRIKESSRNDDNDQQPQPPFSHRVFDNYVPVAFQIAMKCHGVFDKVDPSKIFHMSHFEVEATILRSFKFRLNPPIPQHYVIMFSWVFSSVFLWPSHDSSHSSVLDPVSVDAISTDASSVGHYLLYSQVRRETFEEITLFLIDCAVLNFVFCSFRASTLAVAAMKASIQLVCSYFDRSREVAVDLVRAAQERMNNALSQCGLRMNCEEVEQCAHLLLSFQDLFETDTTGKLAFRRAFALSGLTISNDNVVTSPVGSPVDVTSLPKHLKKPSGCLVNQKG